MRNVSLPSQYFEPDPDGHSNELVVVIHGYGSGGKGMSAVRETIREALPNADIYAPELPFGRVWRISLQPAETVVAKEMKTIDSLVDKRVRSSGGYRSVTFVGHSFGAVLARRLAITAFGEQQDEKGVRPAPFEDALKDTDAGHRGFRKASPWANSNTRIRIVLLAGMNRGWTVSSVMDWATTVKWSVLQFIGEVILWGRPTIFAIRKGAPFLVNTRLQWLALMNPDYGTRPDLVAVQLLGTGDDLVSPGDTVDYSVDLFGVVRQMSYLYNEPYYNHKRSYFYIEVGSSTHANIIEMGARKKGDTRTDEQNERRRLFKLALTAEPNELEKAKEHVSREQMADNLPPESDPDVTDVVFIIHGIRDKGYWAQKLARTIKKRAAEGQKIETFTESYGYFAMLPFLFYPVRKRKVEWLMDRYSEARARYPKSWFHYVGHSNGTYLVARALEDFAGARFKYIVLAGSVVRCKYDWRPLLQPNPTPRVHKVLNYVATRDWVVALFPKALQPYRWFDLGSAGHDGFRHAHPELHEVKYIVGNHSVGHKEHNWNDIADFIVSGKVPAQKSRYFCQTQDRFWRAIGHVSFIIFPLIGLAILGFGFFLLWSIFATPPCSAIPYLRDLNWSVCTTPPTGHEPAWRGIGFFVYLWIVYVLVTRF
jgi:pimeloyl-ACP methyl ester carboxylesterase